MALNLFEKFQNITGVNITEYFTEYIDFINSQYNEIASYYIDGGDLNYEVRNALDNLYEKSRNVKDVIINYRERLSETTDFWDLLDNFEETFLKLETIKNSQRWFRSTRSLNYSNLTQKDYILKQNESLTSLAGQLGYTDIQNDWAKIALDNKLREEDYTKDGGVNLKITFDNNLDYKINSVVGSANGEEIYGRDLPTTVEYDLGEEDLKVLTPKETIQQSFRVLIDIKQGGVPEFPGDGVNKSIVGQNINVIQYPVLFRQLSSIFAKDDSFKEFQITSIENNQDNISIKLQAKTRIGEVLNQELTV